MNRVSHEGLSLAAFGICFGCVVIALVFTMVNTAIPSIQSHLNLPVSILQWMMTAFGLINCACLVTCGRIADIFGRKRIFLLGLTSTLIGISAAGLSNTAFCLILGMSFAGLGNAILLPVSQAMLVMEFPQEKRGEAVGIWAGCIGAAMAAGPVLGGIITQVFGWRWVFLINAPVILVSFFLTFFYSRESRNEKDPAKVDVKGMLYLALTVAAFVLVSTERRHFSSLFLSGLMALGVLSIYRLIKHEKTFSAPIISDQLWKNRVFLSASLASFCLIFFVWSIFFLLPIFFQRELGLSPMFSGLMMLWITLPVAFLSPLIARFEKYEKTWLMSLSGFLLLAFFVLLQIFFNTDTPLWKIAVSCLIFGVGYSLIWGPTATAAISCFPSHQSGIASGTFVTIQELGGTFGLAIIATTFSHYSALKEGFYRSLWLLLVVSVIGCALSLVMKTRKRAVEAS
ncbi:MFS transporter [Waddlia chondrophila]|uniref:Permease, major facilitator superfamily n=1 Tax=Waddlia chondrophila (strain ATCC VR-1470 / WSU 86-1044) TaxID=716544 RepID=D6YRY1_WADCW|nr:MFS transporter [Waddlia chondrophila]ADI38826.1 permease, major facilitator superfamily [Waddlia chondrophila WSU 86-1044]